MEAFGHQLSGIFSSNPLQQQPKIRLRRSKGCAPWGVTPKAARGGIHYLLVTGYTPCGRHSRMATISAMLEKSATLGTRKPV